MSLLTSYTVPTPRVVSPQLLLTTPTQMHTLHTMVAIHCPIHQGLTHMGRAQTQAQAAHIAMLRQEKPQQLGLMIKALELSCDVLQSRMR